MDVYSSLVHWAAVFSIQPMVSFFRYSFVDFEFTDGGYALKPLEDGLFSHYIHAFTGDAEFPQLVMESLRGSAVSGASGGVFQPVCGSDPQSKISRPDGAACDFLFADYHHLRRYRGNHQRGHERYRHPARQRRVEYLRRIGPDPVSAGQRPAAEFDGHARACDCQCGRFGLE
ncbi:MAG: hypothetical protein ACLU9S_01940 [Oscillospiraceae bacterium]